jgi:hypothetical protein
MRAIRLVFWLVCFSLCSMPLVGSAVTTGSIHISGAEPPGTFTLSGTNFTATGGFSIGDWGLDCTFCYPGTVLNVNGIAMGDEFGTGSATINGRTFPKLSWGDPLMLGSSSFVITGPGIVLNRGDGTYFGPFSFTGSLCGIMPPSGVCVADLPSLTGNGQVAVQILSYSYPNGFNTLLLTYQATYTFQSTPEPSSLILFGSGVLGLAGVIRRKINL